MAYSYRYFKPFVGTTETIASGAITSGQIKDAEVKTPDIANDAVSSEKIKSGAILPRHISDAVRDDLQLQVVPDNSISTEKLQTNAVIGSKLADGSVITPKIQASAVTSDKLANSAVTQVKIAPNSVGWSELRNGSVQPGHIRAINERAIGQVPAVSSVPYNFEWITPGVGVPRPITPPVATDEIANGAVTLEKLDPTIPLVTRPLVPPVAKNELSYKVVSITIPLGAISSSSPQDPELVGGIILGYYPTGNQDQYVDNITLKLADDIEILLDASAKAANTFNVVVLKP